MYSEIHFSSFSSSYFAMFIVAMIKGPTQYVSQTLKERNDLPPQMKYLLESHAHAFQWLAQESNNRMSRNIEGMELLIVCQSDWPTIWWMHSIRFPHQMKFSYKVIGLVMLWFHTVTKLWLLPNIKYCTIFNCVRSCKYWRGKHGSQISHVGGLKPLFTIKLKQQSFWQVWRGLSLHIWHQLKTCTPPGLTVCCVDSHWPLVFRTSRLSDLPLALWLKRQLFHRFNPDNNCCQLTTTCSVSVSLSRTLNSHLLTEQKSLYQSVS